MPCQCEQAPTVINWFSSVPRFTSQGFHYLGRRYRRKKLGVFFQARRQCSHLEALPELTVDPELSGTCAGLIDALHNFFGDSSHQLVTDPLSVLPTSSLE
jgi:hypothetical protein